MREEEDLRGFYRGGGLERKGFLLCESLWEWDKFKVSLRPFVSPVLRRRSRVYDMIHRSCITT